MSEQWDMNVMASANEKNADYYTEEAIRIDNGEIYEGKKAIADLLKSYNEEYIPLSCKNSVEDIRISGNLATVRGSFLGSFISKQSGDTLYMKGAWVDLCERQMDGTWKMAYSIGTELKE